VDFDAFKEGRGVPESGCGAAGRDRDGGDGDAFRHGPHREEGVEGERVGIWDVSRGEARARLRGCAEVPRGRGAYRLRRDNIWNEK